MPRVEILRYGQLLDVLDHDPNVVTLICVSREGCVQEISEQSQMGGDSAVFIDLHEGGVIKFVLAAHHPQEYPKIAMPREALGLDVLCKAIKSGSCVFFQPVDKELISW